MVSNLKLVWEVPELSKDDPGSGQIAGQLFEGRDSVPVEQFVREDLQNRVDARLDKAGAAEVFIRRVDLPGVLIDQLFPEHFQDRLRKTTVVDLPEKQREKKLSRLDGLFRAETLPVLIIEDFKTTGLNGPVNSKQPEKREGEKCFHPTNALTTFLRRHGRSGKSDKALGSAGLGRHVYYKASEISTKLVYTVPTDLSLRTPSGLDEVLSRPLLFGQSFQRELEVVAADGQEQSFICYHHLTSPEQVDGYPMPFGFHDSESAGVEALRKQLGFERTPDQTGCSILIPFPRPELNEDRLVAAICAEFALPVLRRQLRVTVGGTEITPETIESLSDDDNVNATNAFLAHALAAEGREVFEVEVDAAALADGLSRELFDKSDLDAMSLQWKELDPVFVDITVPVTEDGESGVLRVSVQKCAAGQRGRRLVARGGLVISGYSDRRSHKSWNGCALVGEDDLGYMLRRSETPAHDKWIDSDLADAGCVDPKNLIAFVRNAHNGLQNLLDGLDDEDDVSIFADVLPGKPKKKGRGEDGGGHGKTQRRFDVALGEGGQEIRITPFVDSPPAPGHVWDVVVVLDSVLGAGRARRSFRAGTFDLRKVKATADGGRVLKKTECSVQVRTDDSDQFKLTVGPCGFPDWADVRVHIERIEGDDS